MKIAIIGGGTAGYMTAAHLTKLFPQFELYHIYDSTIPTIGVGEGTLPSFPAWLEKITDLSFEAIQAECFVTRKFGVQFENWGQSQQPFHHDFTAGRYGYHISAAKIVTLLQRYIKAIVLDRKVTEVVSSGREVSLTFANGESLTVDFAFDARGFPKTFSEQQMHFTEIPTNAALIRPGPIVDFNRATRAVARPHGWIFIIPLTTHTTYGYIHNATLSLMPLRIEKEQANELEKWVKRCYNNGSRSQKHVNINDSQTQSSRTTTHL